jgi:hypothetical protein
MANQQMGRIFISQQGIQIITPLNQVKRREKDEE